MPFLKYDVHALALESAYSYETECHNPTVRIISQLFGNDSSLRREKYGYSRYNYYYSYSYFRGIVIFLFEVTKIIVFQQ